MRMGIEQSGGGRRGNGNTESGKGKRKRKQKQKQKQQKSSAVQNLYNTCKEVFADCGPDIVPSPEKIKRLAALLDGITQADVGLKPNMLYFSSEWAPTISYLQLHECDMFSIGIFCFPPSSVIPLHNHPGMTVFSKLLFGTMHIKAYDWSSEMNKDTDSSMSANANAPQSQPEGSRLAKLKVDSEFTAPCPTSILYPDDGGNMHCFTAKSACAVLDVLGPPYGNREGGHCQYYHEFPFATCPGGQLVNGYAWLKETEKPMDFLLVEYPYNGPKITIE